MPVYLIRAGEDGPVKIGKADDPKGRLLDLQTGHYEDLMLLRVWNGDLPEERSLHTQFKHLHIAREWFRFDPGMLDAEPLVALPAPLKPKRKRRSSIELPDGSLTAAKIIHSFGGPAKASKLLGVDVSAIYQWQAFGIPPRRWRDVWRVAQSTSAPWTLDDIAYSKPTRKAA